MIWQKTLTKANYSASSTGNTHRRSLTAQHWLTFVRTVTLPLKLHSFNYNGLLKSRKWSPKLLRSRHYCRLMLGVIVHPADVWFLCYSVQMSPHWLWFDMFYCEIKKHDTSEPEQVLTCLGQFYFKFLGWFHVQTRSIKASYSPTTITISCVP